MKIYRIGGTKIIIRIRGEINIFTAAVFFDDNRTRKPALCVAGTHFGHTTVEMSMTEHQLTFHLKNATEVTRPGQIYLTCSKYQKKRYGNCASHLIVCKFRTNK